MSVPLTAVPSPELAPFSKHIEHPTGYLKFDKPQITAAYDTIVAGKQFGMNFRSRNGSPERILRAFGFTSGSILKGTDDSDKVALDTLAKDAEMLGKKYAAGEISGPEIASGETGIWGTVLLHDASGLTPSEVEGIMSKRLRIYYVSWLAWTDLQGRMDWSEDCRWLQIPDEPLPYRGELVWHICAAKNASVSETHKTTDSVSRAVHHRTRDEVLRDDIGEMISEGAKIRDRAPIYVGPPIREPGGPDIMAEWTAWNSKVEQFLQQNFDSAEVQKFRLLNNPMTSLNSIVHYEIVYLSDLLNRVGPRTSGTSIGTVTQGPGSALSINQQGGITAGTVNLGPQLRFPEKRIDGLADLLAARRGRVNVSTDNADSITLRDATNLVTAFAKAKWSTAGPNVSIHGTDIGADGLPVPVRTGIHISTRAGNSALAEFIKQAIKQTTGVDASEETSANLPNDDVEIFVGPSE